ncbi:MAG: peroxidase [Chloroflexi bacterium]|nr:peroxidase [Chloroflexota bacterium]
MFGYGTYLQRAFGNLSSDSFSWQGTTYTANNILYNRRSGAPEAWDVVADFSPALPDDVGQLALQLGDHWLNFANSRGNGRQFFWYGVELDWRSGASVLLSLQEYRPAFEPRSIDGYGNNRLFPQVGMAEREFLRVAGVSFDYAMTAGLPERPDPRAISNALLAQPESLPSSVLVTDMFWQWGQFLDHDMTLTPENFDDPLAMPVPIGDPVFDPFRTGRQTIEFVRSRFLPETGVSVDQPREQFNKLTAFLDASNVYGSSLFRSMALRTNDGTGRLKTSGDGRFMPYNVDRLENDNGNVRFAGHRDLFLAGDIRANEQVGLTSIQTLFVREHNRLAGLIAAEQSDLTGQEIYELARKIVGAQVHAITFHEFLPLLLGPGAIEPYTGYDPTVDPTIAMEFSTAAYRIGHTLLSPMLMRIDDDGEQFALSLADAFFTPSLVTEYGISGFLRGLSSQVAQQVDAKVVDQIRNLLFGPPGSPGRDLASLNIQRGRDHGVPSYNHVRVAYGLPAVTSFADITSDPVVQEELREAYGDVDLIDLWPGGLAEDHVAGANVGLTFRTIISDQFRRLRDGDRFWYENDPYFLANPDLLEQIRGTTLADIIRRNTSIGDELPDVAFGGLTPTVAITAKQPQVEEGGQASFVLTRTGTISRALTLDVAIGDSDAVLAGDPTNVVQATFGVGKQTTTLSLATVDDASPELDGVIEASIVGTDALDPHASAGAATVLVVDNDSVEIGIEAGLSQFEWIGLDGLSIREALLGVGGPTDVNDLVSAIYLWNELTQQWDGYFPRLDQYQGFNTLGRFQTGGFYWIDVAEPITWRVPKAEEEEEG